MIQMQTHALWEVEALRTDQQIQRICSTDSKNYHEAAVMKTLGLRKGTVIQSEEQSRAQRQTPPSMGSCVIPDFIF